jgi:glycosyltransferase involved in cell wall biosynthesis
VLVHDDASTDHSADIIREYEKQYPDIVKPIYQVENQYSKCSISRTYQVPRAKGKYIAFCEGDDFWNDPFKLQKQFDEMEKHPEIDMCAHAAYVLRGRKIIDKMMPCNTKTVIDTNNVILGDGGYFATNSLFYRRKMYDAVPEFHSVFSCDYSLQIWGSLRGGVLFLPDLMSTYRAGVEGSWTDRIKKDRNADIAHSKKKIQSLRLADKYTNGKYHDALRWKEADVGIRLLKIQHRYHEIRHGEYSECYKQLPFKEKYRIWAHQFLSWFGLRP